MATEVTRLKKIVADLTQDREMLQDVIRRTGGPRSENSEACSHARIGSRYVERLGGVDPASLGVIGFDHSTFHYQSRRSDQSAVVKSTRELCETRVRHGYRRVHVFLGREGWGSDVKKVYRIYKKFGQ